MNKKQKQENALKTAPRDIRDIMELMEVPIVSLSKNRKTPIIYEKGPIKLRITCHSEHYIASIYDWDIIQCIAGKIQEAINSGQDIPSREIIIPRHELLRIIHRQDGKKQEKDLKASLSRLNTTLIKTTIFNENGRYDEDECNFLERWRYTDREDVKEFKITLSQWLYDGICKKGAMLKIEPEYFDITSGIKKFLYRTARKHVGSQNKSWDFLVETIHEKSGSEQEFKKFKYDLKKAVEDNDIPNYGTEWVEKEGRTYVRFTS
jgi:plasmid replication initiation protein